MAKNSMNNLSKILNSDYIEKTAKNTTITKNITGKNYGVDEDDIELKSEKYFSLIVSTIDVLKKSGVLIGSSGRCLAVSDLLQKILSNEGIESRLVECQMSLLKTQTKEIFMIGYDKDETYDPDIGNSNTHVVVVTDTEIPVLVDLSIAHLDKDVQFICRRLNRVSETPCLSEYNINGNIWTYYEKERSLLPTLHEQSILNRIRKDRSVDKNISNIFKVLILLGAVTTLNFVRGIYDFQQKYINKTNGFGPSPTEKVIK
jgi:hypothetical protein